jgi:hypothetical protein
VVEGGGLENRCAERYRGFESYSLRQTIQPVCRFIQVKGSTRKTQQPKNGEMAESAEGARLLSECRVKALPRVRIPLSPPF